MCVYAHKHKYIRRVYHSASMGVRGHVCQCVCVCVFVWVHVCVSVDSLPWEQSFPVHPIEQEHVKSDMQLPPFLQDGVQVAIEKMDSPL